MSQNVKSRTAKKQVKKSNKKINWKKVILSLIVLGLIGMFVVAGVVFSYVKDAPPLNAEELQVPLSTTILDRNGNVVAELGTQKRENIEYGDIPQVLEDAVLATEDARFYDHIGIDFWRIGGAVIANIKEGFGAEGASTITQQVVKNAFLTHEKSLERKIQEQYLAIKLDSQYKKKKILTMYLNMVPYGKDIYGVKKASEAFFGKSDLSKLTLPEAALLAGIPQRPNAYNPFIDPKLAKYRRDMVLDLMVQHNKITEQQAEKAKKVKIEDMVKKNYESNIPYDSFIEQVLIETGKLIDDEINVYQAGLTIHTTLDPEAQKRVEYLLSEKSNVPFPDEKFQAGVAAIDTKTGEILAIGGGRNKEGIWGGMNYAINPNGRQPGSAIKPIMDYGPAIEYLDWSTYHQLLDEEIKYNTIDQYIRNYTGEYYGWVSMRKALYRSLNVPAVKTFHEVGADRAKKFAKGLGLPIDNVVGETDAIGGGKNNVNPLQLAGAYAAFGNGGVYNEPHAVRKIVYPEEKKVIEVEPESSVAMADHTAYMITDVLKDVIRQPRGTANGRVNVGNLPVAAKTGTTNRGDAAVDSWLVGYSTNYTIAVWSGYPKERDIPTYAVPPTIFSDLMTFMSKDVKTPDFQKPESVVEVAVEEGTKPAKLPSEYTPEDEIVTELFIRGTEPTKVSEKYDQLEPVTDLKAKHDKDENSIQLSWKHPLKDEEDIAFRIRVSVDGSEMQEVTTTQETKLKFTQIAPDKEYTFEVTAINPENEENQSEPVTASVKTPSKAEDFWDDFFNNDKDKKKDDKNKDSNDDTNQDGDSSGDGSTDDGTNNDDEQTDGSTDGTTDGSQDGTSSDGSGTQNDGSTDTTDNTTDSGSQ